MDRLRDEFFDLEVIADLFPGLVTEAAKNTLVFTSLGFSGGLLLGLLLALMRISRTRWLRWPAAVVVDTFRGLPALLVIVFIGFGIPIAFPGLRYPFPKYTPGCLALAIVAGAYIAETIRAGIEGVPRGQMEAARSLGMRYRTAMRRVVLPQAFRLVIPPLTNELALLFKDTSLLAVLGTEAGGKEILKYVRDAVNRSGNTSPLVAGGLAYLLITLPLLRAVAYLESRARASR
ncbi:MAG: amino acid ABC transporter permease [Acidimicrobiales bacterium]